MTAGDPTRADIERAAAKLFGPAGARAFCDRVERAALLAALSISQEAYAEDQIQKRTGCWAVAPEGDKEVLVERASGRAMDHPDGTPLEQYWTPHKHKDEDLADELLELFRGVENYRGNYIGFTHLDGAGDMTVGFGHYLSRSRGRVAPARPLRAQGGRRAGLGQGPERRFRAGQGSGCHTQCAAR